MYDYAREIDECRGSDWHCDAMDAEADLRREMAKEDFDEKHSECDHENDICQFEDEE